MSEPRTLISSENSPFGRITRIARLTLNLQNEIIEKILPPAEAIAIAQKFNPLGKLPILSDGKGDYLYDSRTILEYFYTIADPSPLWPSGVDKYVIATRQSLALGVLDAALLLLYENRYRPLEMRSSEWEKHQHSKIDESIKYFALETEQRSNEPIDIGDVSFAVALDYLEFRFQLPWRDKHPSLDTWHQNITEAVTAFSETKPTES